MTFKSKGRNLYKTAYRFRCSTCPATAIVPIRYADPKGWKRKNGKLYCDKCVKLAQAVRTVRKGGDE